jgi:hypothetical protein
MEEEELVFPSDVDAEIRDLEGKFSESLRLLGKYVKNKIQGKGMAAVRKICEAAERSNMLRITNFNHEEKLLCQQQLSAVIQESIRIASEAVSMLATQEGLYVQALEAEQARIAAAVERKRLADEEAVNLFVARALRVAEIETQKLAQEQAMGPPDDVIMIETAPETPATDKGKDIIVDTTPPQSPIKIKSELSSSIPPTIQVALDEIKNDLRQQLRDEMDVLRADMGDDMNRSDEATHKKIDAMMALLLKLTEQQPKP